MLIHKGNPAKNMQKYILKRKVKTVSKDNDTSYECTHCEVSLRKTGDLKRHIQVHSLFQSDNCAFAPNNCKTQRDLLGHFLLHSNEKLYDVIATVLGLN